MRKILLGVILAGLMLSTSIGLIYFSIQVVRDIQNNAEWEINFMRIICIVTVIVLALPSVYKAYKKASSVS